MVTPPQGSLRILVVSNVFAPQHIGGAEVVALRHAKLLTQRGHSVQVLAGWLDGLHGDSPAPEYSDGLRVYRIPFSGWDTDIDFHVRSSAKVLAQILEENPVDVVHFHNLRGMGVNLIAEARRHGARTVVTLHDNWGHCLWATRLRPNGQLCQAPEECALACSPEVTAPSGTALPMRLRRDAIAHALEGADQLISPSHALARFYVEAGFEREKIQVVSNGIDLSSFSRKVGQAGPVRFAFIASLAPHKGLPELMQAAALLKQDAALDGRWELSVIGEGGLRSDVERLVVEGGLADVVRLVGRVERDQMPAMLREIDTVVLPSRWPENEPVVLLEAIASGVSQIATDLGGSKELVDAGRSGLLVEPGNAEGLARAMAALILSPRLAGTQGDYNWERRADFDEEDSISAILALYASVLERGPARTRPIVLCNGETPNVIEKFICDHLYRFEGDGAGLRLVWHEWAEPEDEMNAALRWEMGRGVADFTHAFRQGAHTLVDAAQALDPLLRAARHMENQ
jgi:glycosyltransferase involved in cell wall biosynthesis